jgi:hypothetical protein
MIYTGPDFLAVVLFGSSPLLLPPLPSVSWTGDTEKEGQLADGRGERGWAMSRVIRLQESLVLYNSFNTLWVVPMLKERGGSLKLKFQISPISPSSCHRMRGGTPFHLMKFLGIGGRGRVGEVMLKWGGGEGG